MNKIKEMVEIVTNLQDKLNSLTIGSDWVNKDKAKRKDGAFKTVDWVLDIDMELTEAVDSLDWKHWKASKNNFFNFEVELIDTLHFFISLFGRDAVITNRAKTKEEALLYTQERLYYAIIRSLNDTSEIANMKIIEIESIDDKNKKEIESVEYFIQLIKMIKGNVLIKDYDNAMKLFIDLVKTYHRLINDKLDIEWVFKGYIVKNVLNEFRQYNGYGNGNYKKNWFGQEDNVVAFNIGKKIKTESLKDFEKKLMEELEKTYKDVIKSS